MGERMRRAAFFLMGLAFFVSCDGGPASPIVPGGNIPPLVAALPEDDYLGVAWLDGSAFLKSEFGVFLTARLPTQLLLLHMAGIDPERDLREIAVALRFDARAWPNISAALQPIMLIRTDLDAGRLEQVLSAVPHEVTYTGEVTVYAVDSGSGPRLFIALLPEQKLLITTAGELVDKTVALTRGEGRDLTADARISALLARADKTAAGWFTLAHTPESRNLLQMVPPFEQCIGVITAGESLETLMVMVFADDEGARRAVKQHELNLSQMKGFIERFAPEGDEARQSRILIDLMEKLDVRQLGSLAVYRMSLTPDLVSLLLAPPAPLPTEEPEESEQ